MLTNMPVQNVTELDTLTSMGAGEARYGQEIEFPSGNKYVYAYWDGSAPTTASKGDFVFYGAVGKTTAKNNPAISAAATSAVMQKAGVLCADYTTAGGVWLQTAGQCDFAKLEGTTDIAIGDQIQMVNAQLYAVKDGGTGLTADSIGIALVAYDTNSASTASKSVYLHGREITIG